MQDGRMNLAIMFAFEIPPARGSSMSFSIRFVSVSTSLPYLMALVNLKI
jgi:hypothetical protein